jgi:hypothetical protein
MMNPFRRDDPVDPVDQAIGSLPDDYFVGLYQADGTVLDLTRFRRAMGAGHRVPSRFRWRMRRACLYTPVERPEWRDPAND